MQETKRFQTTLGSTVLWTEFRLSGSLSMIIFASVLAALAVIQALLFPSRLETECVFDFALPESDA